MSWGITLWPAKAQFRPGETVQLVGRVSGPPGESARLLVIISRGADRVGELTLAKVPAGESLRLTWSPPPTAEPWQAFGLDATLEGRHGESLAAATTAFDIATHWRLAPRYGFLADFGPGSALVDDEARLEEMLRLHLNVVQFYDWMYNHHTYLPPAEVFMDPLGRVVDFGRVRRRVARCQELGMAAMAYGSVYGAEWDLMEQHPEWLLYDGTGQPMNFAGTPFWYQNLSAGCGWRQHLLGEYRQALGLGFAGIHCDTYGSPRRGLDHMGREIKLDQELPGLVAQAQHLAVTMDPAEGGVIFNNVGGWPLEAIAREPDAGSALYVEVWAPHSTYRDLYEVIMRARRLDPDRQVILAAYMHAWHPKTGAGRPDATAAERGQALAALKLTSAAIFASGGFHLLPGEGRGVLAEAYYPTYGRLTGAQWEVLRAYWDFHTRYGPWLADRNAVDATFTHSGGPNRELRVVGAPAGPEALPGTVWVLHKESGCYRTVHLINLTQVQQPAWSDPQPEPIPVRGLEVRLEVLRQPKRIWAASPDQEGGRPRPVTYRMEEEPHTGLVCVMSVSELETWEVLVVEEG